MRLTFIAVNLQSINGIAHNSDCAARTLRDRAGLEYWVPQLSVPATGLIALTAVLLPTIIVAIALGWRGTREQG
ncbi:MAG: hypothetical protein GDA43_11145 [Hormoscilla sp. SP5CHS1]|nr:hypothetical protein [Hormoscilla sp. SP5CHS1]